MEDEYDVDAMLEAAYQNKSVSGGLGGCGSLTFDIAGGDLRGIIKSIEKSQVAYKLVVGCVDII